MTDIVERLRNGWRIELNDEELCEAADEIERLREAVQSTSKMIELMCKAFDISPEDFVINVNANKETGETRLLRSISAQEVLNKARTALGEKE